MKSVLIFTCLVAVCLGKAVTFKDCGKFKLALRKETVNGFMKQNHFQIISGSVTGTLTSVDVEPCDNPTACSLKKGTSPVITIGFTTSIKKICYPFSKMSDVLS